MSMAVEQALLGLVKLVTNARRPLPDPQTIGSYLPTLTDLHREAGSDIVMQFQAGNPKPLDGGDSAHRTGVLAFCGSALDNNNLDKFHKDGWMVRHPTDYPWNNPKNCSRDQLFGYIAGCWRTGRTDIVRSLLIEHEKRGFFCQNTEADAPGTTKSPPIGDPLGPHDLMYFRICTGDHNAASDVVSQLALYVAIQASPQDPSVEKNQLLLQSVVCCQLDFLLAVHDRLEQSLHLYWSGDPWRGQKSIAVSLWDVVQIEKSRYSTPSLLDYLLPPNIMAELRDIDWKKALKNFAAGNPLYFTELAGKLVLAALRDIEHYARIIYNGMRTLENTAREVATGVLKALHIQASIEMEKITNLLVPRGVDPFGMVGAALSIAGSLLGFGSSTSHDDEEEKQFRQETLDQLRTISGNTDKILKNLGDLQLSMEANFAALTEKIHAEFYVHVLDNLVAEAVNAEILIKTLEKDPSQPEIRERLGSQADRLRVLISRSAKFGSDALPVCFHVYGILMTCLSALGSYDEITITRDEFGPIMCGLLTGDKGLNKKITGLKNEIKDARAEFALYQGKILIGAVSIPEGEQRNMDSTKDIFRTSGFRVSAVWCTVAGTFAPLNITQTISVQDLGHFENSYSASNVPTGVTAFSGAKYVTPDFRGGRDLSKYHSADLYQLQADDLAKWHANITSEINSAILRHLQAADARQAEARRVLPGFETLKAAVSATFFESAQAALSPPALTS